jgi:hypothetical protein
VKTVFIASIAVVLTIVAAPGTIAFTQTQAVRYDVLIRNGRVLDGTLAKVVGDLGGVYESHIRDEADYGVGAIAAVEEVIRISEEGHLPGIVAHMKALGPASWRRSNRERRVDPSPAR